MTNARILAIDDDHGILQLYQALLSQEGYEVLIWQGIFDQAQGLEKLGLSLVILDLKTQTSERGIQYLQQIRQHPPTISLPILVCTAAIQELEPFQAYLEQEHIPVLEKPFDIDDLLNTVAILVQAHHHGQENTTSP